MTKDYETFLPAEFRSTSVPVTTDISQALQKIENDDSRIGHLRILLMDYVREII